MQAKAYKGMGMEGSVAKWYAKTTHRDLAEFKALARRMAGTLPPGAGVLEIAPGPGYFAIELAKVGKYKITGVDISKTFVEIARKNAQKEGVELDFRQGNASALPFDANSFDLIVCRAAFKNFSDPIKAVQEMHRVLKPGGRAVVIDLRPDVPRDELYRYVDGLRLSWMSTLMTKWTFRFMLLKRAYTPAQFRRFAEQAGFEKIEIPETPIGFEASLTK